MIGKICSFSMPFYNIRTGAKSYKLRPALIIYGPMDDEYTVLPVSTIKDSRHRHPKYDVKLDPANYPRLQLRDVSYVRTHKQATMHKTDLHCEISNMKAEYPEKYTELLQLTKEFNDEIRNAQ